jgi:hypothetical protein
MLVLFHALPQFGHGLVESVALGGKLFLFNQRPAIVPPRSACTRLIPSRSGRKKRGAKSFQPGKTLRRLDPPFPVQMVKKMQRVDAAV